MNEGRFEYGFLQLFNTNYTGGHQHSVLCIKGISYGYDHSDNAL
jgi:hypothetical protein